MQKRKPGMPHKGWKSAARHRFAPDIDTPSQADFIRRIAALPHTADDGPATEIEMGGALRYLNDAIQVAREIVVRDSLGRAPE